MPPGATTLAAHQHRHSPALLNHDARDPAFHPCAQFVLQTHDVQTQAAGGERVDARGEVLHAIVAQGEDVFAAGHVTQDVFNLACQCAQGRQIRAKDFHGEGTTRAREHLRHPHFDGLGEPEFDAGKIPQHAANFIGQPDLVRRPPGVLGLQGQKHVALVEPHGV